jgi:hypothetical protein
MMNGQARRSGRAWAREVLAAIDGLGPRRWRHPLGDVQPGKMPLKGLPEDVTTAPSPQPHVTEIQQRVPGRTLTHRVNSAARRSSTQKTVLPAEARRSS